MRRENENEVHLKNSRDLEMVLRMQRRRVGLKPQSYIREHEHLKRIEEKRMSGHH